MELKHHGIKGQKWGERRAEWYPIADYQKHLKESGKYDKKQMKAIMTYTKSRKRARNAEISEDAYYDTNKASWAHAASVNRWSQKRNEKKYEKQLAELTPEQRAVVEKEIAKYGKNSTTQLTDFDIQKGKTYVKTMIAGQFVGGLAGSVLAAYAYDQFSARSYDPNDIRLKKKKK